MAEANGGSVELTASNKAPAQSSTVVATKNSTEANAENKNAKAASLSELFGNATAYDYFLMFVGSLGGIVTGVSIPLFNVLFGRILDALNDDPDAFSKAISNLCISFVVIAIANFFTGLFQVYCWSATGERQTQKFRERYVNAVLSQEIGWFDTCGASEISTKLAELVGKVQDGMCRKVGDLIQYVTQVVAAFIVAFYLNWKLTVVLIAAIPIIGAAGAFMITAITAAQYQSLEQYANAGGLATETLNAVRTVTALNMQPNVITRYRKFLFDAMEVGMVKGFKVGVGHGGVFCACFLTYALGFWYGGKLVADDMEHKNCFIQNCLTGGEVMAVFFSTIMGSMALGQVAPPLTAVSTARAAVAQMLEVIHRKPLIDGLSNSGLKPEQKVKGEITLKDVEFAYPSRPDIQVCKGYNLSIQAGETIALVGPSGCGKSTIINLLLRFYDPQSGSLSLDEYNIKELNIKWLRSQIGYVGQEPILFSGTIAENIAYGLNPELGIPSLSSSKRGVSPESDEQKEKEKERERESIMQQVIAAAKLANAHDFISRFPMGYDTDVGSNGVAMSGGQKQRIAIARALIKKPAVLLLDEATSALDAHSERVVQRSIDALSQSKAQTTIVIAHRLSTIRNADKICVISEGRIQEIGKHEELIAKEGGLYADLVRLQMASSEEIDDSLELESPDAKAAAMSSEAKAKMFTEAANAVSESKSQEASSKDGADVESGVAVTNKDRATAASGDSATATATEPPALSKEESSQLTKRIWSYLMKFPGFLLAGLVGAAIFGAIFPCWGYLLANTQDMFYLPNPDDIRAKARLYAFFYILLAGAALFSSISQYYGIVGLGEKVSSILRSEMFEAIMRRSISYFDREENAVGNLTTKLADDSRTVNKAFGEGLAKQLQAAFTLLIGLALGFSASWQVAFVVLACFPLSIISSAIQMQAIAGQQYDRDDTAAPANNNNKGNDKATTTGAGKSDDKDKKPTTSAGMTGGHSAMIATAFTNMRTVSAFSLHHKVSERYAHMTAEICEARIHRAKVAGAGFGGSNCVLFLTYALLFWYGSKLIKSGDCTFVDLMTSILTLMLGALGLGQALADMGDQKSALKVAKRIFKDMDESKESAIDGLSTKGLIPGMPENVVASVVAATTEDAATGKSNELVIPRAKGRIELKNVSFTYPTRPNVRVCKGYSLCIEAGETIALVGPSGSGKSTIINLLLRFYDPDQGEVLLDGHNLKDLNVRWLRSQIGYVGQEPVLFAGSVAENVGRGRSMNIHEPLLSLEEAMAKAEEEKRHKGETSLCDPVHWCHACNKSSHKPVATDEHLHDIESAENGQGIEDVIEACKLSNAHDFISTFTDQYETDIGEGSIMVSGGQKQRIAIARALIKKPAVLLLDEATSALDAGSERVVQQSIDALSQSKAQTTIVIAHRLTTIRNADRIYVVDQGEIVEVGKHEELLEIENGLYKQLWEKQSGGNNDAQH